MADLKLGILIQIVKDQLTAWAKSMPSLLGRVKAEGTAAGDGIADGADKAAASADKLSSNVKNIPKTPTKDLRDDIKKTGEEFGKAGEKTNLFEYAFRRLVGLATARQIILAADSAEQLKQTLGILTGSTEAATAEFQFLRAETDRMGLSFDSASRAYVQLATAAKGTALEGEKTREIFSAVAGAMARIGKSSEVDAALFGITKAMGDGTISSREFFGMLSKFLPNALQVFAAELGVTTDVLQLMLDKGEIAVSDALPKFAKGLNKAFGNETKEKIDGIGSGLNRAFNSISKAGEAIANLEILHTAFNGIAIIGGVVATTLNMVSITLVAISEYLVAAGIAAFEFFKALASGNFSGFANRVQAAFTVANAEIDKTVARIVASDENLRKLQESQKNAAVEAKKAADEKTAAVEKAAAAEKKAAEDGTAAFKNLSIELRKSITDLERTGDSADALKKVFNQLGAENAFTSGQKGLEKINIVLDDIARKSRFAGSEIRDGLIAELENLTDVQIRKFQSDTELAFQAGETSAKSYASIIEAVVGASYKKLGLDVDQLTGKMTAASRQGIASFLNIAEAADQSGKNILKAFTAALDRVKDVAGVKELGGTLRGAFDAKKIGIDELNTGLERLAVREREIVDATSDLAAAYQTLGIKSKESLEIAAQKTRLAFEAIRDARAPIEDIKAAFLAYAKASIEVSVALGKPVPEMLKVQAATLGVKAEFEKLVETNQKLSISFESVARAQDQAVKGAEAHTKSIEAEGRAAIAAAQAALEQAKQRGNALEITRATIALAETESAVAAKVAEAKRAESAAAAEKVVAIEREALADGNLTEAEREVLAAAQEVAAAKLQEADAAHASADAKAIEATATRNAAEAQQGIAVSLESAIAFQREQLALTQEYGATATDVFTKVAAGIEATFRGQNGLIELTGGLMERLRRDSAEAAADILRLTAQLNNAADPTDALTRSAAQALEKYRDLGDEALAGLRKALDDATQRTLALRDAAKSTLEQLRDQFDQLKGNEEAIQKREFERRKKEIEDQLKAAEKAGDSQAVADLRESLRLLEQIRLEKEKQNKAQEAEDKRRRKEAEANRKTDTTSEPPPETAPEKRRIPERPLAPPPFVPPTVQQVRDVSLTFNLYTDISEDSVRRKIIPIINRETRLSA